MDYWCYYCTEEGTFGDVVHHCIMEHPNKTLKFRERKLDTKTGKRVLTTKNYKFTPTDVYKLGKTIDRQ